MRILKSNPTYTELAHFKAVYMEVIYFLKTEYTNAYGGGEPNKKVIAEDVFKDEIEVPVATVSKVASEIEDVIERLSKEMAKFTIEKSRGDDEEQRKSGSKKSSSEEADVGVHGHKRQGRPRKRAAADQR